jgi:hypothetical protein
MKVTRYNKVRFTAPNGEVVETSISERGISLPVGAEFQELRDEIRRNDDLQLDIGLSSKAEWNGYKIEKIDSYCETYTLGVGDGINAGSRHYHEFPDGDPRNGAEDKSYDKYGHCRDRAMNSGDVGFDGPDEL